MRARTSAWRMLPRRSTPAPRPFGCRRWGRFAVETRRVPPLRRRASGRRRPAECLRLWQAAPARWAAAGSDGLALGSAAVVGRSGPFSSTDLSLACWTAPPVQTTNGPSGLAARAGARSARRARRLHRGGGAAAVAPKAAAIVCAAADALGWPHSQGMCAISNPRLLLKSSLPPANTPARERVRSLRRVYAPSLRPSR